MHVPFTHIEVYVATKLVFGKINMHGCVDMCLTV